MGEWEYLTLEEVCAKITDGAHNSPTEHSSGKPMASVKDLTRHGIIIEGCKRISPDDFANLERQGCRPQFGDVLIAKDGNSALDTVCVHEIPDEVVLLSSVAILRPNGKVTSDFLRYYLDSSDTRALLKAGFRSGSAIPRVVLKDFRKAPILLPSIGEQKKITPILRALDDKIELNRRMNETLETMARALFKSWFVGFDPVRAKSEGRDLCLPQAIAAFLPDSLVDSDAGEVPAGWATSSIYEIATFINGAAYRDFEPNSERLGLPIIKIAELKAGVTNQTAFSNVKMPEKFKIDTRDILFSWSGNPDTSIDTFVWALGAAWLNQHIFRVAPSDESSRAFVLLTLQFFKPVFAEIARNKQTTGLGHVTVADLKRLRIARPPQEILLFWNKIAEPLLERSFGLQLEINSLASIREALLPKLISGEIRVKAAEKIVEAVA